MFELGCMEAYCERHPKQKWESLKYHNRSTLKVSLLSRNTGLKYASDKHRKQLNVTGEKIGIISSLDDVMLMKHESVSV